MRKQGTLVNDAPREEARSLCDAADDQVSRLEVLFREIAEGRYQANAQIRGLGINMTQVGIHVAGLLSTPGEVRPYHVRPREQHIPTRVVEMVMPPWLQKQAFEEALLKMEVEKRLSKHSSKFGYNPMSLSFENSQFIVPACVDFMHLNRRTVKKLFPEVHTCYCNVFTVPPGQLGSSYGLHHASTPGAEYAPFGKLGWFSPAFHMSFHTALTPTSTDSAPFTVFDGHPPETFNVDYVISELQRAWSSPSHSMSAEQWRLAQLAFMLQRFDLPLPRITLAAKLHERRVAMDYLTSLYWRERSCANATYAGRGTHWRLKPGQALLFNNWRAHSDSGFGTAEKIRVSLDLRCLSEYTVPRPFDSTTDFFSATRIPWVLDEEGTKACLLALLNYSSPLEFLETVGLAEALRDSAMPLTIATGSVMLGELNGGQASLMHESNMPGMRRHYQRVRDVVAAGGNLDAFRACRAGQGAFARWADDRFGEQATRHLSRQKMLAAAARFSVQAAPEDIATLLHNLHEEPDFEAMRRSAYFDARLGLAFCLLLALACCRSTSWALRGRRDGRKLSGCQLAAGGLFVLLLTEQTCAVALGAFLDQFWTL